MADPTARVAIALKNVSDETEYDWVNGYPHPNNTTIYSPGAEKTDMEGYKWTWEAAGTTDGTIKANQQTAFPAFYAAGHYNPGVPISGTLVGKKWYLAGWGEWLTYGAKSLGFGEFTYDPLFYRVLVDESFTKVGGTKLIQENPFYLMSTQTGNGIYTNLFKYNFRPVSTSGIVGSGNISGHIRPFIKY